MECVWLLVTKSRKFIGFLTSSTYDFFFVAVIIYFETRRISFFFFKYGASFFKNISYENDVYFLATFIYHSVIFQLVVSIFITFADCVCEKVQIEFM